MNLKPLFFILMLLLIPTVSASTIQLHVSGGNGTVSIYEGTAFQGTASTENGLSNIVEVDITLGNTMRLYAQPANGYTFEKWCFENCNTPLIYTPYIEDVDYSSATIYAYFVPESNLVISQVTATVEAEHTHVMWLQNINGDIILEMDGYTKEYNYYNAGLQFYTVNEAPSYGLHNVCVNGVCIQRELIAPTPTPTPTPIPANPILTIVQIIGNGSVEVYDNNDLIGNIQTSHNFNIGVGHNISVVTRPGPGYHTDKICDHTGCSAGNTKITYIDNLDFINIAVHFIADSVIPPLPTPAPNTTGYTLSIGNTPIGMGKIMLWLDGQKQSDITSSMNYNLALNTDVEIAYYPYSGVNYLKNSTINGIVNTSTIFSMTKNYTVIAYWTEDVTQHEPIITPTPTPQQQNISNNQRATLKDYSPASEQDIVTNFFNNLALIIMVIFNVVLGVGMGVAGVAIGVAVGAILGIYPPWVIILLIIAMVIKTQLFH